MPRTGGVYSPPAGTKGVPNTTIQSVPYNTLIDDLAADANAARPVTAGGTGATSASGARTALGLEVGSNVQAYDAGLQSIAGLTTSADQMPYATALDAYATTALTPFARTLIDDSNASAMLSTLGVSDFMKTVLDDGDAATARSTLGANNASNLTTGTVADARLPTTLAGKTFNSSVYVTSGTATSQLDYIQLRPSDYGVGKPLLALRKSHVASKWEALLWDGLGTGGSIDFIMGDLTWNGVRMVTTAGAVFSGQVTAPVVSAGGNVLVDGNGDRVISFRTVAGVTRGMVRHDQANDAMIVSMFNSGGGWYRDLVLRGPEGYLEWGGSEIRLGGTRILHDGNIYMPWAGIWLHEALNSKITTDGRSYPRRVGGSAINFHWSGQGGQPSWLWGGNDGQDMYVYNPSNFSVNYANSAGSAGTLSNWAGWAGTWIGVSRIGGTVYHNTTGRWLPVSASGGNNGIAIYYGPSAETAVHNHYAGFSGGNDFSTFGIVPPGWYYSFNATLSVFEARN